ncbi:GNAT family N-acetyltransferase [Olivibacter sp. CPCC 100613]|uniref:GNAT family N-acetyltransferase n=1 Tax=Olivibacter sp. CPCC 100613 TaxID=3079931 RepID=UPI002FFBD3D8
MIKATYNDKQLAVDILTDAFKENKSVNYIVKQDAKKNERVRNLMSYSFEVCCSSGDVFFSDDKTAVALVSYPDKKKITCKSVFLDLGLIFKTMSLTSAMKALKRESLIKKNYPTKEIYYLWFIGVSRENQGKGKGTQLLKELIEHSDTLNRKVYLETSTLRNIPWYEKFGFRVFKELNFDYTLYMFTRDL